MVTKAAHLRIDPDEVLSGLNAEQQAAAQAVRGPVVILAGAGTGKTRVISHRVAYAVATGAVDERVVLVVSFTNKAAGEMAPGRCALRRRDGGHLPRTGEAFDYWPNYFLRMVRNQGGVVAARKLLADWKVSRDSSVS